MNRFFKKPNPAQKLWLSGVNAWCPFERIDDETGVLVTSQENVITDIQLLMRSGAGGVVEISEQDYKDLQDKKKEPSAKKPWREEFDPKQFRSNPTVWSNPPPVPLVVDSPGANVAAANPPQDLNKPLHTPDQAPAVRPSATKQQT